MYLDAAAWEQSYCCVAVNHYGGQSWTPPPVSIQGIVLISKYLELNSNWIQQAQFNYCVVVILLLLAQLHLESYALLLSVSALHVYFHARPQALR